ncbi:MAG TPA: hypothetical protein VJA26_05590 [Gammaproteobacteria bacterium]|nr:hypothetical protein [Gammaproteobacteria bacterium]
MKWLEAFYQHVDKPSWTNREASGLIRFARSLVNTFIKEPDVSLTPWDWYAYALPALGWDKPGDKFKIDTKHQLQTYPASAQLRAALVTLTSELDDAGKPFRLIVDPRGTDAVFRQLAKDAWAAMQQLGKEGPKPPELLARDWEAQAAAARESAAAAAAGKKKKPQEPSRQTEVEFQPVDAPIKTGSGGGGGALFLLLLFAFGRKKRRR